MGYINTLTAAYDGGEPSGPEWLQVPDRPSPQYQWVNGAWVVNTAAAQAVVIKGITDKLEEAMDAKAAERNYDDILSAISYASQTPAVPADNPNFSTCEKFRLEANALLAWRSLVYATCYAVLAQVQAGQVPMPTPDEAVAMMPPFTWPD